MLLEISFLKKRITQGLVLSTVLLSGNMIVSAGEYYVSPYGTATWYTSSNISTPTSALTAMSNAQAGDTVYFRGGTYDIAAAKGSDCSYSFESMRLMPTNSGSNGNPIVFQAYPGETPVLNDTMASGQDRCIIMGAYRKAYITIDGLSFQTNNGLYHAGLAFFGYAPDNKDTGNVVKNCTINGGSTIHSGGTQWDGLRIEDQTNFLAHGNRIFNFQGNDANTAAIKMYHDDNAVIENNEVYNSYVGIYPKSDINNSIFRYNYVHDCSQSWRLEDSGYTCANMEIYHNVTINSSSKDLYVAEGGGSFPGTKIYNNTFYSTSDTSSLNLNDGTFDVYNNILVGRPGSTEVFRTYRDNSLLNTFDHNQFGDGYFRIIAHYLSSYSSYTSLSSWELSGELDGGGNPTSNYASDPLFVNISGNMDELGDFRLQGDSPCKGAGRAGADIGANIDLIGPSSSKQPSDLPGVPLDFQGVSG